MEDYGFWSLVPSIVAIILAIWTKQVFISLLFGIWFGWLIINGFSIGEGTMAAIQALVDVFKDSGNTRTIIFTLLVGSLIVLIQRSGGVQGFINWLNQKILKIETQKDGKNKVLVQLLAWITGILIFIESNISILIVGTLYRPIFDKLKISREKLAYIADSSSAPASILIPFNGWGAFIMSLLVIEGFTDPFGTMVKAIAYNFYPVLALIGVALIILFKKDFGPMSQAEKRTRLEGKILFDGSKPMMADELTDTKAKKTIPHRAYNMIIPVVTMVLMMPVILAQTGWSAAMTNMPNSSFTSRIFYAIGQGSGSTAVLVATLTALTVCLVLFKVQKVMGIKEMVEHSLKGMSGMVPLAFVMTLAFAIGAVCKEMQTGIYVADVAKGWLSPGLVPMIVFIVSCFIAFSTGTSWGTFAIMIAIAVPMSREMDANVYMAIAAALGGGVFGDHCSPISDTTIISSMAAATDHIDHVRTQMPYAMIAGGITILLYLLMGLS